MGDDTWDNKYDRRGEAFRDEFLEEIHLAIIGIVKQVKEARGSI